MRAQRADLDPTAGLCADCKKAPASGPCAACETLICGDCGVFSRDPDGVKVVCGGCASILAHSAKGQGVSERKRSLVKGVAVVLLLSFALGLIALRVAVF